MNAEVAFDDGVFKDHWLCCLRNRHDIQSPISCIDSSLSTVAIFTRLALSTSKIKRERTSRQIIIHKTKVKN
jgi:hypothetical protein